MKAEILNIISKKIGTRIRKLREVRNMSQQDLADICNFDKSDMSKIESGKANPTLKTFLIISQSLEVNISELFLFDNENSFE
jgi:transcriptional regulator with XRE-family HTH domain